MTREIDEARETKIILHRARPSEGERKGGAKHLFDWEIEKKKDTDRPARGL